VAVVVHVCLSVSPAEKRIRRIRSFPVKNGETSLSNFQFNCFCLLFEAPAKGEGENMPPAEVANFKKERSVFFCL
jgi:hypothetical protein